MSEGNGSVEDSPDTHPRFPPKPRWDLYVDVNHVEFQTAVSRKPLLRSLRVNNDGNVVDTHGNIIAKLTSGELETCTRGMIDDSNNVIDTHGMTVGHVDLLSDIKEFRPDADKEGTRAEQEGEKNSKMLGEPNEDQCAFWDNAPNSKCYASFGDEGTTATVGAYGHLMQVSQYLEAGRSGMFALGSRKAEEPRWPVDRAQKLEDMSHNSSTVSDGMSVGLSLNISGLRSRKRQPLLKWVNWRWPRFEYSPTKESLKISVQWMVHDHIVLQQWIVKNEGSEDRDIPVELGRDMWIQDLEYLDYSNNYNDRQDTENTQYGTSGPHDYGWVLMHPFDKPMRDATSSGYATLCPTSTPKVEKAAPLSPSSTRDNNGTENSIATAVMAVFVDGCARKFGGSDPKGSQWIESVERNKSLEITAAYKMILVTGTPVDYRNFLIPASAANVTKFLADEIPVRLYSLSAIDLGDDHIGTGLNNGSHRPKDSNENAARDLGESATTHTAMDESRRMSRPSGCPKSSSLRSHIDFSVWRNLEYILSVCAVKLNPPSLIKALDDDKPAIEIGSASENEVVAVALTCGDFSGHRLCNSASFFAFEFLMDIAQRLKHIRSQDNYISNVDRRIKLVCKGHILWLLHNAEISEDAKCLKGDYFVTGRAVAPIKDDHDWNSVDSFVLKDAITDNPFHIIKAFGFMKCYEDDAKMAFEFLNFICLPWVRMLEKADKRAKFAWPHRKTNETNVFRLDDHVWIWKALKCLEESGVWGKRSQTALTSNQSLHTDRQDGQDDEDTDNDSDHDDGTDDRYEDNKSPQMERARLRNTYNSAKVQTQMLQRFTTLESDVTKTRMLAVTRSTQQTRFLFHARDTVLFYGEYWGCFSSSDRQLWNNTVKAQQLHSEDDESEWDNTIRYGLGLIMGTNGFSIGGLESRNMTRRAVEVLFQSTSPNAFFPGQLDDASKQPTLFYRDRFRDFYFHASFEVPYILLTHANRICSIYAAEIVDVPAVLPKLPQDSDTSLPQFMTGPFAMAPTQHQTRETVMKDSVQPNTVLKKAMPFGTQIDQKSITELTDEWLYNYPAFLENEKEIDFKEVVETTSDRPNQDPNAPTVVSWDEVFKTPLRHLHYRMIRDLESRATVIDIGRKKRIRRRGDGRGVPTGYIRPNLLLRANLGSRTAETAKKRLVWLPKADSLTALICYAATPDVGRQSLFLFFQRHSKFDNYFNDDTTRASNLWETEMHLSFYLLTTVKPQKNPWGIHGVGQVNQVDFPGSRSLLGSLKDMTTATPEARTQIARVSFGFHFTGDFFDRYWTCHFIEHKPIPAGDLDWDLPFDIDPKKAKGTNWRQRKVLELYLCDRILDAILEGGEDILSEAKQALHVEVGLLAYEVRGDGFKRQNELWESIQPILRTVRDELSAASSTLSTKWALREKDREAEAPRWTRNDERKYRGIINKLSGSTNRKIADVERVLGRIDSLEKFLDSYFERKRTRLSNDNMARFTYVTVVFLPLGFATGVFSMGGAPDTELLISMIVCAIVALLLTVITLMIAQGVLIHQILKALSDKIHDMSDKMNSTLRKCERQSWEKMQSSRIFQSYTQRHRSETTEEQQTESQAKSQGSPPQKVRPGEDTSQPAQISLHWLFWPVYLLVEVPAWNVLRACRALHGQNAVWTKTYHIVLGITSLPLFILSWAMQLLCYNIMDLIRLAIGTISRSQLLRSSTTDDKSHQSRDNTSVTTSEAEAAEEVIQAPKTENLELMSELTYPLKSSRPLERLMRNLAESKKATSSDKTSP